MKRKRGRPRKTTLTLREDMQTQNNPEQLNMNNNESQTNEENYDWDKEIDGNQITQEVTETPINEELKVESIKSDDNSEEKQQASTNGFVQVNKENSFKEPTIIHLINNRFLS
ncbi:MAG: hypothetical protein AAFR37_22795 [Cyanobacteria bacterium J06628_3]